MYFVSTLFTTACLLLSQISLVQSQIIIRHGQATVTQLDPVRSPGKVASHMHCIVGGSKFGSTFTPELAHSSTCTTASVKGDNSNYWTPCLYFEWKTGGYTLVPHTGALTYYLNRPGNDRIEAFPEGFAMASGDANRRTFDANNNEHKAVSFVCLGGQGDNEIHEIFDAGRSCPGGWRVQVNMPQCWDGKNVKSADNSHVSYAMGRNGKDNGDCPPTHPHHMISLFYEFFYLTKGEQKTLGMTAENGRFVLSTGDPTGYSGHGDFTNGWDQKLLEDMVSQCFNKENKDRGFFDKCPPLIAAAKKTEDCVFDGEIADTPTGLGTKLAALPGCNPVTDTEITGERNCPNQIVGSIISAQKGISTTTASIQARSTSTTASSFSSPTSIIRRPRRGSQHFSARA